MSIETVWLAGTPIVLSTYPLPELKGVMIPAVTGSYDYFFGGRGHIVGTVKEKATPSNLPVIRRVRLHETKSGILIKETWSDAAGNYTFAYIDPACPYYVVAFDHTGKYRGVVADALIPKAF